MQINYRYYCIIVFPNDASALKKGCGVVHLEVTNGGLGIFLTNAIFLMSEHSVKMVTVRH